MIKEIQGKFSVESSIEQSEDQLDKSDWKNKNFQGALQFKARGTNGQSEEEENDQMINQWKDNRLKKLEDFTRDLLMSANSSSNRKIQYESGTINMDSEFSSLRKTDIQPQINTVSPSMLMGPNKTTTTQQFNNQFHQQKVLSPIILQSDPNSRMGSFAKDEVRNNQNSQRIQNNFNVLQEVKIVQIDDDEELDQDYEEIEDDMLLTKSDGTLRLNSHVLSTQRSQQHAPHQQQSSGEFEKRITDIKAKLNQIKNTINTEIENSFIALNPGDQTNNGLTDSENTEQNHHLQRTPKPTQHTPPPVPQSYGLKNQDYYNQQQQQQQQQQRIHIQQQQNTYQVQISRDLQALYQKEGLSPYNNYNQQSFPKIGTMNSGQEQLQHNSVLSSLDNFQNRLNVIKSNLNQPPQQTTLSSHQQSENNNNDRYLMIKTLIDHNYNSNNSPGKNKTQQIRGEPPQLLIDEKNTTLEQTVNLSAQRRSQLPNATVNNNDDSFQQENETLRQRVSIMAQGEQMLHKKLEQVIEDQSKEKQRYEEQLRKMQEEMGKMCELIQDINKQKKGSRSNGKKGTSGNHQNCNKRKRIMELEIHVKELQSQLQYQSFLPTTATLNTQLVSKQDNTMITTEMPSQQQTIDSQRKDINLPRKMPPISQPSQQPTQEKQALQQQVNFLEQKLKSLQTDLKENKDYQQTKDQLRQSTEENEYLKQTYNRSYVEMMQTFQNFKDEMERKNQSLEQDYQIKYDQIESNFREELERRSNVIEELQKENQHLKEKITKIKDVFDMPRTLSTERLDYLENQKLNKENQNQQTVGGQSTKRSESKGKTTTNGKKKTSSSNNKVVNGKSRTQQSQNKRKVKNT